MPRLTGISQNLAAALDMIAVSEIGAAMLAESDDGYNVIVGSRPGALKLFTEYDDHPNVKVEWSPGKYSTAAGRYQILYRFWAHYKAQLGLPDFGPESQDRYAIQQIRERKALDEIERGDIRTMMKLCSNIWASLPGAGYGQHENSVEKLVAAYEAAGGTVA